MNTDPSIHKYIRSIIQALCLCLLSLTVHQLPAQSEAETATSNESVAMSVETVETTEEKGQTILDMFKNGGWAMYPLGLLSVFAMGLIVYNFLAINSNRLLGSKVLPDIETALKALDLDKARSICSENDAPSTNIIHAGLARADIEAYDSKAVKEAIEESSTEELAGPFVLINYLSVIGSLAPMVGLLGTVSGMVKAFNIIGAEGAANAQALAGNISEALITTASGMIVGIPAMFFFFYFKNKYGKITSRVTRVVGDLQFTLGTAIKNR